MALKTLPVRLAPEQVEALEVLAQIDGVSMAEEIRQLVDARIKACRKDKDFQARLAHNVARTQKVLAHLQAR